MCCAIWFRREITNSEIEKFCCKDQEYMRKERSANQNMKCVYGYVFFFFFFLMSELGTYMYHLPYYTSFVSKFWGKKVQNTHQICYIIRFGIKTHVCRHAFNSLHYSPLILCSSILQTQSKPATKKHQIQHETLRSVYPPFSQMSQRTDSTTNISGRLVINTNLI